jgi:hypothetical protein
MPQVTRNQPGVSSGQSPAWHPVPADRPARDNSAMGRHAAGPRPHVAMLDAHGPLSGSDDMRLAPERASYAGFLVHQRHLWGNHKSTRRFTSSKERLAPQSGLGGVSDHAHQLRGALKHIGGSKSDDWNKLLANQAVEARRIGWPPPE